MTTVSLKQNLHNWKQSGELHLLETTFQFHLRNIYKCGGFVTLVCFVIWSISTWFIWGQRNRNHVTLVSWSNRDTHECLYYFPCFSESCFMITRETWHFDLSKIRPLWKTPQHYTAVYSYLILFIGSVVKITEYYWDRVRV